ncbi:hypothetical protein ILT44_01955 [Microvirga sp. BT689]|uniref:hypothetical protein n=1 Tax=Microvirga arvi TaxID=2778731 RepID=UPI001950C48D|nr:hypothetical protein [Microvirga arvi]MBM6578931.1 hypothetical protein [Microvirga arvi]
MWIGLAGVPGFAAGRCEAHREGWILVKRIGSKAWRVQVANDGAIVVLGIRTDTGREYEILLGAVDTTPILTDLLNDMVRTHQGKPPRSFAADAGPNHAKSVPVQPLRTSVDRSGEKPVLVLDFGGTVLKVAIDPAQLQQALSAPQG